VVASCAEHGLDPGCVLAVVDGPNDLELLTHAAVAVVPEVAHTAARALADRTIPSAEQGGCTALPALVRELASSLRARLRAMVEEGRRPSPDWVIDELSTAGRENLDPVHAGRYDSKEDAGAAKEVDLLVSLGMDDGTDVVDLGAGTGQFAVAAAATCNRLVAVDVSEVMLDQLRAKVAVRGITNIEIVNAGFVTYEHAGRPADFVYSRWALHQIPDFWKSLALTRMRRSLRAGGVLRLSDIVYCFEPDEAEERLEAWCATLPEVGEPGEWVRSDIVEHIHDEHSTYSWLLEPMIERCGFRIEDAERSEDGLFAAYVARAV
jgi:ubiquinone/menaquinone biosynthesis C-methylase UbiE